MTATFANALTAVRESLTTSTARPRAIGADFLFGSLAATDVRQAWGSVREKKRAFVDVVRIESVNPSAEIGSVKRYALDLRIFRFYWCGEPAFSSEYTAALALAADDTHRIREALCWPGALNTTTAAQQTGLDGGALYGLGHSAQLTRLPGPNGPGPILQVTDLYRATIELDAQTVS